MSDAPIYTKLTVMSIFRTFLLLLVTSSLLISCQKELSFMQDDEAGTVGDTEIKGLWRFVGIRGFSVTEVNSNSGGISVLSRSEMTYFSTQASGNLRITDNAIQYEELAYEADAEMRMISYFDGSQVTDITVPMPYSFPASNDSSPITWITSDSIKLRGNIVPMGGTQPGAPAVPSPSVELGGRFKMKNDTLILLMKDKVVTTAPDPNFPGNMDLEMTAEVLMLK